MKHVWPIPFVLALAACSATPTAQRAGPDPQPDHRKLIADNLKNLFSADAHVRDITVSELSQVPSPAGLTWGACVRVAATSMTGRPTAPRTYVITFSRNTIAERRAASGDDCAGATLTPLGAG